MHLEILYTPMEYGSTHFHIPYKIIILSYRFRELVLSSIGLPATTFIAISACPNKLESNLNVYRTVELAEEEDHSLQRRKTFLWNFCVNS